MAERTTTNYAEGTYPNFPDSARIGDRFRKIVKGGAAVVIGTAAALFPPIEDVKDASFSAVGDVRASAEKMINREFAVFQTQQTDEQKEALKIYNYYLESRDEFPFLRNITVGRNGAEVTNLPVVKTPGLELSEDVQNRHRVIAHLKPNSKVDLMRYSGTYPLIAGQKSSIFVVILENEQLDGIDYVVEVGFVGEGLEIVPKNPK